MRRLSVLGLIAVAFANLISLSQLGPISYAQVKQAENKVSDASSNSNIVAWVLSSKLIGSKTYRGPYFKETDSCFDERQTTVPDSAIRHFSSSEEAEKAGFIHSHLAIQELGKYSHICSSMYAYFWDSSCEKILFENEKDAVAAGFQPVERFDLVSKNGPVLAFEGGKLYYTSCDPEYECLLKLEKKWQPLSCNQGMKKSQVLKFATEADARKAGYYPGYKYFYDEGQVEF